MEYTPLSKTKISYYSRLRNPRLRKKEGLFCVEGTKCVKDIVNHFPVVAIIATKEWLDGNISVAASFPDKIFLADSGTLSRISTLSTTSDVIAVFKTPERRTPPGELGKGLYLLLDGIQDPGNLGTIIRSAHWFGFNTIFASRKTADIYSPKTIQATMGSIASVNVYYCDLENLVRANSKIPLCILDLKGENLFKTRLPESAFIAMGSEGEGLSRELRLLATYRYTIPPKNKEYHPDSLNVAIASSITMARFSESDY